MIALHKWRIDVIDQARTSVSHPIRVDFVQPLGNWGKIGLSFCPGKKQVSALSGSWCRDLELDLQKIKDWGASTVVSLIEDHEFAELKVPDLPQEVLRLGMNWIHLPIRDRHAPDASFNNNWESKGAEIAFCLSQGQKVFIHCKGGLGRAGTVVACLLMESGMDGLEAIDTVRQARRNTIETVDQEFFVLSYTPKFL